MDSWFSGPHLLLRRICGFCLFVLFLFFASVIQFLKGATSGRIGLFWLTVWEDIVHHGRRDMAAEALQQGGGLRQLLVSEY